MNSTLKKYLKSFLKYILAISSVILLILSFYLIITLIFYDQEIHEIDVNGMIIIFLIPVFTIFISKYFLNKLK